MGDSRRRNARTAICLCYGLTGVTAAIWGASLPALDARLDLGTAALGALLMVVAAAALVAMPLAGILLDRVAGSIVLRVALPASAIALLGPALTESVPALFVCAAVLGALFGILNVSLSVAAVAVELATGPVMSTAHGVWTLGAVTGGAAVAAGLFIGLDLRLVMCLVALVVAATALASSAGVSRSLGTPTARRAVNADPSGRRRLNGRAVVALGLIGAAAFVSEGAATDWAGIHATRVLGAEAAQGSLVFTGFFAAMTVVRFAGDALRGRFGPRRTIGTSGAVAAAGYLAVLLSPLAPPQYSVATAMGGWILAGAGMAIVWPIVASTVGAAAGSPRQLSLVTAISFGGGLVGPGVIGLVAGGAGLSNALLIPAALAALVAIAAPAAVAALATRTTHREGDRDDALINN